MNPVFEVVDKEVSDDTPVLYPGRELNITTLEAAHDTLRDKRNHNKWLYCQILNESGELLFLVFIEDSSDGDAVDDFLRGYASSQEGLRRRYCLIGDEFHESSGPHPLEMIVGKDYKPVPIPPRPARSAKAYRRVHEQPVK